MNFAFLNTNVLLKMLPIWCVLLLVLFSGSATSSLSSTDDTTTQMNREISPTLLKELTDFLDLIPTVTIDELVAKYYIIDGNFRTAIAYVRSSHFAKLMNETLKTPEIIVILDALHMLIDCSAKTEERQPQQPAEEGSSDWWQNAVINVPAGQTPNRDNLEILQFDRSAVYRIKRSLGSFTNFVSELMGHLPRPRYVDMIQEKRNRSTEFARFYESLRSAQLRPLVEYTMTLTDIQSVLDILKANGVDAKALEPIAFDVISWGPTNFTDKYHWNHYVA